MPSLIGTDIAANYKKHVISQSGVGQETIVSITTAAGTLTDAKLQAVIDYMTLPHGTGDGSTQTDNAFTVGGIGTADGDPIDPTSTTVVYARMQGTHDLDVTDVNAATGVNGVCTVAVVAVFKPAL